MNLPVFPVYHFLVSAAILVFVVIFWRTHHRDHRNWLALRLFVLCSVNRWPLRMVKGTIGANKSRVLTQRYYVHQALQKIIFKTFSTRWA